MRKSVIVVEGQTEQIFAQQLLQTLAVAQPYHVELIKLHGGTEVRLSPRGVVPVEHCTHHIRIVNAANDEKVNSYIEENLDNFKKKGFESVYGLRDSYTGSTRRPKINTVELKARCERLELEHAIDIDVIVAEAEIEAWFLAVPDFFTKYDADLTLPRINEILGLDLQTIPIESIPHPSQLINNVLETVNQTYRKKMSDSYKIATRLDYEALYLEKVDVIPSLRRFMGALDNCLSPCVV